MLNKKEVVALKRKNAILEKAVLAALALFAKDHAIDRFNWGAAGLRERDIRELNELPKKLRDALAGREV